MKRAQSTAPLGGSKSLALQEKKMSNNAKRIEEASLNAWPALQQVIYDGWILRFSKGYTKRANSITPLFKSSIDLAVKIEVCERRYQDQNLPPIFRLPSIVAPEKLDQYLLEMGYSKIDPTWVMQMELKGREFRLREEVEFCEDQFESWLENYSSWNNTDPEQKDLHAKILNAIPTEMIFASVKRDSKTVACGLGVIEDEYVGIFDLITAPEERRQGFGTNLLNGILQWSQTKGATCAYLQVMMNNKIAWRMYQRTGFENLYHYWYRVRE